MPDGMLRVTAQLQENISGGMQGVADSARLLGDAEKEASKQLTAAGQQIVASKRAQLSATEKVETAIRKETAAGDKAKVALLQLQTRHSLLTKQMRAMARAGEAIPPVMVKQAAALRQTIAAANAAKTAEQGLVNVSQVLSGALGLSLASAFARVSSGLKSLATDAISSGDELAKLSQRTGVTVEALQELRFAAKSAGVEQATMDKSLKMLGRSMGEASAGTKTYADAFRALGIDIKDGDGKLREIDDVLMDVADGLSQTESQADKLAIAQRLLGRSGSELVNVLQDGSVALEEMRERKRQLGLMSADAAANAEKLTQAMTELDERSVRLTSAFNENLAPALTTVIEKFSAVTDWAGKNSEAIGTALRVAYGVATLGISEVIAATNKLALEALPNAESKLTDMGDQAETTAEKTDKTTKAVRRLAKATGEIVFDFSGAAQAEQRMALQKAWTEQSIDLIESLLSVRLRAIDIAMAKEMEAAKISDALMTARQEREKEATDARMAMTASMTDMMIAAFGTAQQAADTAAAEGGNAMDAFRDSAVSSVIQIAKTQVMAAAAKAAAEAISAMVGIPVVGPVLGAVAGASVYALVSALMSKIPGAADGGVITGGVAGRDSVPIMGMPGEPVIPVDLANQLREVLTRPVGSPRRQVTSQSQRTRTSQANAPTLNLYFAHGTMDSRAGMRVALEVDNQLRKLQRRRPRFD